MVSALLGQEQGLQESPGLGIQRLVVENAASSSRYLHSSGGRDSGWLTALREGGHGKGSSGDSGGGQGRGIVGRTGPVSLRLSPHASPKLLCEWWGWLTHTYPFYLHASIPGTSAPPLGLSQWPLGELNIYRSTSQARGVLGPWEKPPS